MEELSTKMLVWDTEPYFGLVIKMNAYLVEASFKIKLGINVGPSDSRKKGISGSQREFIILEEEVKRLVIDNQPHFPFILFSTIIDIESFVGPLGIRSFNETLLQ